MSNHLFLIYLHLCQQLMIVAYFYHFLSACMRIFFIKRHFLLLTSQLSWHTVYIDKAGHSSFFLFVFVCWFQNNELFPQHPPKVNLLGFRGSLLYYYKLMGLNIFHMFLFILINGNIFNLSHCERSKILKTYRVGEAVKNGSTSVDSNLTIFNKS